MQQWILSGLAVGNALQECDNLRGRILFEKFPGGTQHLPTVVDAMQNNLRLIMLYGSFAHEPREFLFSPYAIKVFRQRWYVVGESSDHPGEVRVYSFDRIYRLQTTGTHFRMPKNFNAEEHFAYTYGVSVGSPQEIETIRIRVTRHGVPFLRSLPLHPSQRELETHEDYSLFQYTLAPNNEFFQELLSRGDEIEVLSPDSFRTRFAKTIAILHKRYNQE